MVETENLIEKESLKLERNSKGYNWTIRISPINEVLCDADVERLRYFNDKMCLEFGRVNLNENV